MKKLTDKPICANCGRTFGQHLAKGNRCIIPYVKHDGTAWRYKPKAAIRAQRKENSRGK